MSSGFRFRPMVLREVAGAVVLAHAIVTMAGGCFAAEQTLGFFCEKDADCAADQRCDDHVCGRCNDGVVDPGELCVGRSQDYVVEGQIVGMFVAELDGKNGRDVAALTNDFCPVPGTMPPEFVPCFRSAVVLNTGRAREYVSATMPGDLTFDTQVGAFATDDFDGDGAPDGVLGFAGEPVLFVVFGFGVEATNPPPPVALVGAAPAAAIRTADLDGDGNRDIVAGSANPAAPVTIFWGDGTGGFSMAQPVGSGAGARLSQAADFDGDGRLEFAVGEPEASSITVLRNLGDRTFDVAAKLTTDSIPRGISAGDLDGDDRPEIVASLVENDVVVVFPNVGGALVESERMVLAAPPEPSHVLLTDANQDEAPDILVAASGSDRIGLFLNRDGTFDDRVDLDVGAAPLFMLREDLDGDGGGDLVVANGSSTISLLFSEF